MQIIAFFDRYRKWNNKRTTLLQRMHIYGIYNAIWDFVANIILGVWFIFSRHKYSLKQSCDRSCDNLVISFTSFPLRISRIWMTVESLLRQTIMPSAIVLYLSRSQFPEEFADLPKSLLRLRNRGLDIRFVEDDIRSHKKYFYAFRDFPKCSIITVDDDALYPENLIETLWNLHCKYPAAVIGNRAKRIFPTIPRYEHWPAVNYQEYNPDLIFIGCAGILYPPNSLHKDAFDIDAIKRLAFSTDDIWLSCMARINGTPMLSTGYDYHHLQTLIPGNVTLIGHNAQGSNQHTVEKLNAYYLDKIGKRPFVDMVGCYNENKS